MTTRIKGAALSLLLSVLLLPACAGKEKAALADWLHSFSVEGAEISFWSEDRETSLTAAEVRALAGILTGIGEDSLTENRRLAGITPTYGITIRIGDESYHINQADAPLGESEISFSGRQWWIKSTELRDFMLSLAGS